MTNKNLLRVYKDALPSINEEERLPKDKWSFEAKHYGFWGDSYPTVDMPNDDDRDAKLFALADNFHSMVKFTSHRSYLERYYGIFDPEGMIQTFRLWLKRISKSYRDIFNLGTDKITGLWDASVCLSYWRGHPEVWNKYAESFEAIGILNAFFCPENIKRYGTWRMGKMLESILTRACETSTNQALMTTNYLLYCPGVIGYWYTQETSTFYITLGLMGLINNDMIDPIMGMLDEAVRYANAQGITGSHRSLQRWHERNLRTLAHINMVAMCAQGE